MAETAAAADRRTFRVDALTPSLSRQATSQAFKAFPFPFSARPKETDLKVESVYCHRFGFYQQAQRRRNVLARLAKGDGTTASVNEQENSSARSATVTSLGLARLEKAMVRVILWVSWVYTI